MRKTSLSIVITLLFLNIGIFLRPDDSHGADSNDKVLKPLQHFINIGKLSDGIKKQIEERGKADVIITLNDDDAQEKARQMRASQGLYIDTSVIIDEKARIHTMNKGKVLNEIPTNDYTVLKDYDKFPIVYIEVNENALKKLLHNPAVKIVGENNKSLPLTEQSLALIGSLTANAVGATGAGISVAVLDSGLEYTLTEFGTCSDPPVPNASACRVDFVHDFAPAEDPPVMDDTGHGTDMSAIVHRVAPQARLLGLDVQSSDGLMYDSHQLAALNWVMANINTYISTIRVVNMSSGWPAKYTAHCPQDNLASAVASLKSAGVATVISSGNDRFKDGIERPACIPDAISVGAVCDSNLGTLRIPVDWYGCTDNEDEVKKDMVPCWSNSASFLTMLAPGAIISAITFASGTSPAAAHVSGAVAAIETLLPGLSVDSVRALLTSTGAPVTDTRSNIVKPRLDLYAATPAIPTTGCQNFARIVGGNDYASLEPAYDAAAGGNTILATKSINTITNPERQGVLTIDKSLTFKGGYDYCNFTTQTGYAFIRGDVHISSGTVTMERIGITE